jgi:HK97 family phage major capsid protein
MSDIDELNSINHEYRKSLERFQKRTGLAPQAVDSVGSGEEKQKFDRMDADMTAIERSAQNARAELEARLARLEKTPQLESRAGNGRISGAASDPSTPEFSARWLKAMITNDQGELRAMATSTTNAPVPTEMERRIIGKMYQNSVLRQIANVQNIDSKRTITVESTVPTASLVTEANAVTPTDFTFGSVSVVPYKYVSACQMSVEFVQDAMAAGGPDTALSYVADRLGIAIARATDSAYTVGTGSSQPQGIGATGSTAWATTNAGRIINQGVQLAEDALISAITADNVIDCVHAVPPQYRASPRFQILLSDTALRNIRKLKDTAGYYVFSPAQAMPGTNVVGLPGTIYGVNYNVGEYVATTDTTTTTTAIRGKAFFIVGNWDYFSIFDRTGIDSMLDPYSAAANLQQTLYTWFRTDSKIILPEAFAAIYALNAT